MCEEEGEVCIGHANLLHHPLFLNLSLINASALFFLHFMSDYARTFPFNSHYPIPDQQISSVVMCLI